MNGIDVPRHLHRQVGQVAIVGFEGPEVRPELRALAREFDLGGVILFARNIEAPEQVAELVHDVQQLSREIPMWISVDQEGGRVARLRRPFTEWPPMAALGNSGDDKLAEDFARVLAAELKAVGISMDFTPVLDVHTNPQNPVIGDRAIGEKPEDVARLGSIVIRTLQANGVAACGKHFPGHGDTSADSHVDLPLLEHPPDRLRAVELVPFRAAIEADVASMMVAHMLIPALDGERPSSLSRTVVHDLLRDEMGYQGLILSDDLGMRAISDRYSVERAAIAALAAGSDSVLLCDSNHDRHASTLEAIVRAAETGEIAGKELDASIERHRAMKVRFSLSRDWRPAPARALRSVIGSDEHQAVAARLAEFAC